MENTGYTFNFQNTKILDRDLNWNRRILFEMFCLFIYKGNLLRKKEDTQNLQNAYTILLNNLKNIKLFK